MWDLSMLELYSDGLCEPINPGGTAIWAFVARERDRIAHEAAGVLGMGARMSSNYAESYAALEAVRWAARERPGMSFVLRSDSEFVVKAAMGSARAGERETAAVVEQLEALFRPLHEQGLGRITWIPRQLNDEPDLLTWRLYLEVDGRTPRFGPRAP
jgi:ribonuclease HI